MTDEPFEVVELRRHLAAIRERREVLRLAAEEDARLKRAEQSTDRLLAEALGAAGLADAPPEDARRRVEPGEDTHAGKLLATLRELSPEYGGRVSVGVLITRSGVPENIARTEIGRLVERGLAERVGQGMYRAPAE